LTGVAARSKLRDLRESNPEFWNELANTSPPEENLNLPQPEDDEPNSGTLDDVDVPIEVLVKNMVNKKAPKGYVILPDGGMEANTAAETFEDDGGDNVIQVEVESGEPLTTDLGRGKRRKKPNQLYNQSTFWRHNDSSDSEID
jgi:hypothetical protein